jgi:Kdo2-lipid IVA lauroyltransferase/acyltransferase
MGYITKKGGNYCKEVLYFLSYVGIRLFGLLFSVLPYSWIHKIGKGMGTLVYYLHRPFRKKTLTNLSLVKTLYLTEKQKKEIAKQSFHTLVITCLEFFRLKKSKNKIDKLVMFGASKDEILQLIADNKGIIFLTGHQANWEVPFLLLTQYHPCTAIGRPIKNKWLYRWVLSIREMHKGKIVMPKRALVLCQQALQKGDFVGIVGDQAFPESSYSYPFLGVRAWTTTAPALLAYRTNTPMMTIMSRRFGNEYHVWGSPLCWPDTSRPAKEEIPRLMDIAMGYLEESIRACPGQWLWQHDRWKQTGIDHVERKYRYSFILITLPKDPERFLPLLPLFKKIYPRAFISLYAPLGYDPSLQPTFETHFYEKERELFQKDWRYQILFDFYDCKKLRRHFLRLGAFQALYPKKFLKQASLKCKKPVQDLEDAIKYTLCKPDTLQKVFNA